MERAWMTPYNFVQNNPILRVDPTGMLDTMPDGRWIWEMTEEEKSIFHDDFLASAEEKELNEVYRQDYINKNGDVNLTLEERLYLAGHWLGLALPSSGMSNAAQASDDVIRLADEGAQVVLRDGLSSSAFNSLYNALQKFGPRSKPIPLDSKLSIDQARRLMEIIPDREIALIQETSSSGFVGYQLYFGTVNRLKFQIPKNTDP